MASARATIANTQGIHCRPAAAIAEAVKGYAGELRIVADGGADCDPRSVLDTLTLALQRGATVGIRVSGPDEQAVCAELVALFEREFDFPSR